MEIPTKKVFITVGTTKFPKLINKITTEEVLRTFLSLGYNLIQIQTGKEISKLAIPFDSSLSHKIKSSNPNVIEFEENLILKFNSYFENFEEEILSSDLVISHAGAGTCLEVLHKNIPLLVVINEDLMDNHQIELAKELQENGYLYYSTCDTLCEKLRKDFSQLKKYPKVDTHAFSTYLDKCVGF